MGRVLNVVLTKVLDGKSLQVQHLRLETILLMMYSYGDDAMILGQDMFYSIRSMECFETHRKNTPIAVRLPLGCALSSPLPSTSGLSSTCFKVVT